MQSPLLSIFLFVVIFPCTLAYNENGWKKTAQHLADAVDHEANPCKDFYQFACGKWEQKYAKQHQVEPLKAMSDNAYYLLQLVKELRENQDPNLPEYKKSLQTFSKQCINSTDDFDEALINHYKMIAERIGSMPMFVPDDQQLQEQKLKFNMTPFRLMGELRRHFNTKVFLDFDVQGFPGNCSRSVEPTLALDAVIGRKNELSRSASFYINKVKMLAEKLGINITTNISAQAEKLEELEERWTKLSKEEYADDQITNVTRMDEKVFYNTVGPIDARSWQEYFNAVLPEHIRRARPNLKLAHVNPKFMKDIRTKIEEEMTYRDFLDYAYLRLIDSYLKIYMDKDNALFRDEWFLKKEPQCLEYLVKYAGAATARLVLESYTNSSGKLWKSDLELLAETVFSALRFMIHTADWLSVDDKAAIIDKVNNVEISVGIPDWIFNDTALMEHTPKFDENKTVYENILNTFRQKFDWKLKPLETGKFYRQIYIKPYDVYLTDSGEPDFKFGASYVFQKISLSFGAILPPMYNAFYHPALKYGMLGWIIGHELFHGFDSDGVDDRDGLKRWISEKAVDDYRRRLKCIIKKYSTYCYKKAKWCISGDQTLDDNIADMDGLKIAYMAYKFATQTGAELPPLPGFENYTNDQLFFMSAARVWCGRSSGEVLKMAHDEDVHSPPPVRVELSMMNFRAFARSFNCPIGSRYAPLHTCSLWGDFMEPNIADPATPPPPSCPKPSG